MIRLLVVLVALAPVLASAQQRVVVGNIVKVNPSANISATHLEWVPSVAVTTLTSTQTLAGRRSITAQNLSAATIYLGFDATNITSTGTLGYKLAPGDVASFDFGSDISVSAVATAATSTGAALQVLQAK